MNKIYIVAISLLLLGCEWDLGSSYSPTTETAYIDYYREACDSTSTDLCLRMRFDTDDEFVVSTIDQSGFDDLEWGTRYTVSIEVEYDDNGDDEFYSFNSIDSSEVFDPTDNNFVLTFYMSSDILLDNYDDTWTIAGEKTFSCEEDDCNTLAESYRDSEVIQLSFSAENDELTLLAVSCSASETSFETDCEGVGDYTWDIAHYRSDCGLYEPKLCMLYKEDTDASTEWQILPFEITDFTPQWGLEYEIDVEATIEAQSLTAATFIEQDESPSDETGETFNMIMRTGASGLEESDDDVITYDGVEFDCSTYSQCSDIDDAIDDATDTQERLLLLEALVETSGDSPVILIVDLLCDDGADDFQEECVDDYDDVYWIE